MLARVRAPLLLSCLLLACSSPPAPPVVRDASAPAPPPPRVAAAEPPAANVPAPAVAVQQRGRRVAAPKNGCAVQADQSLGGGEFGIALDLAGQAAVLLASASPPALTLWLGRADGTFAPGPSRPLEAKLGHAAAACDATHCELSLVDARARLLAATADHQGLSAPRELAQGIDRRFAPAIALDQARVHYAYTRSVDEAMHTLWVTRSGERDSAPRDLTPDGHGAAAATFMLGTERPTLVFIDAHAGISPLLELTFNRSGQPSESVVRTPVSQPYEPPLLSAVQWPTGQAEVVFSAVGRLAMTAIARVPLRKAAEPTALSPSRGYGALAFAAALSSHRALFALEVPAASTPNAPRTLVLKLLDGTRTDDVLSLPADTRRPSVATAGARGQYLLSYAREQVVHAVLLACDD
jgi:hypothetical protein